MKSPPAPWNIPVPRDPADTAATTITLPIGPWNLPTPGTPVEMRVTKVASGTVTTMTYDEGTIITATFHDNGTMTLAINRHIVVDPVRREIRILRN